MLDLTALQVDAFVEALEDGYRHTWGHQNAEYGEIIRWAGSTVLEIIAGSDAVYHDVEHTMLVTLVGQEILRGKHVREGRVSSRDWLHVMVSLLCHDIGYVKGVCRQDRGSASDDGTGRIVELPQGATDAALTAWHVDRGKKFVAERFSANALLDVAEIQHNIEQTRFPVPAREDAPEAGFPAVVQAADLIGQLGDPRYLSKIPALFYEFQETGVASRLGYAHPGDLRRNYPRFYWTSVFPFIQDALACLSVTQTGRQMRANLFANIFMVEHEQAEGGPR